MASTESKRRYGGRATGERRSERRARLIEAAIALYGRQGYRNTGVRAVCQEAGLTERYFYESFANSEALLAAAYDEIVDRMIDGLRAIGTDPSIDEASRPNRTLGAYYAAIRDHPEAARVFLVEINGVSPAIDAAFERSLERFAELILDSHDPTRVGPAAAEPLLRRGIVGGLHRIALAWIGSGFDRSLDEVVAAAMPFCLIARPGVGAATNWHTRTRQEIRR